MNLKAPATQVQAMILGEHGDSMVPVWSSASVAGLPLEKYPGLHAQARCRRLPAGEDLAAPR